MGKRRSVARGGARRRSCRLRAENGGVDRVVAQVGAEISKGRHWASMESRMRGRPSMERRTWGRPSMESRSGVGESIARSCGWARRFRMAAPAFHGEQRGEWIAMTRHQVGEEILDCGFLGERGRGDFGSWCIPWRAWVRRAGTGVGACFTKDVDAHITHI